MKRFLILAALAAVAAPAAISGLGGDEVAPAPAWLEGGDAGLQAYRAAKIYVDGTTVHEDAYLLVRDGKVAAIVADEAELPPFLELKDLGDVTVMPGLVDGHIHPTFGEWTPAQNSVGWIHNYLHGGTTSMVSGAEMS